MGSASGRRGVTPVAASSSALLAISHGTSSADGHAAIAKLVDAVAARLPDIQVLGGYVDVERPNVPETIARVPAGTSAVIVPLLLSAGYHVHVDLVRAADEAGNGVSLAAALGPDRRLVRVLRDRLEAAGFRTGDGVILAAAGSSDPRAITDCEMVAELLASELSAPVTLAFHSTHSPSLHDAIAAERARDPGCRVVVSSYLLAPGFFQSLADNSEADLVTEPILSASSGPPEPLVALVVERYREAADPSRTPKESSSLRRVGRIVTQSDDM
jgi:sirohydrochlorin ferrochelatase